MWKQLLLGAAALLLVAELATGAPSDGIDTIVQQFRIGSASPTLELNDTSAADHTDTAEIVVECSDAGSGTEDCDLDINLYQAGTKLSLLNIDADSTGSGANAITTIGNTSGAGNNVVAEFGFLYGQKLISAGPTLYFYDSDMPVGGGEPSAAITTQCSDVEDGTEDCGMAIYVMSGGLSNAALPIFEVVDGGGASSQSIMIGDDLGASTDSLVLYSENAVLHVDAPDNAVRVASGFYTVDLSNPAVLAAAQTTFAATTNSHSLDCDGGGNSIATITGFPGSSGMLVIRFEDANCTIEDQDDSTANTINLLGDDAGATDFVGGINDTLTLWYDGTSWFEIARAVNTDD